jgi:streptogramin lyase
MRLNLSLTVVILFLSLGICAQIPMGTWRMFTPNNDTRGIEQVDDKIFVAFENGLFEHDTETGENDLWTAANYLSDVGLTALEVHTPSKTLVVSYQNGNIDLIQNNVLINLPALVLATIPGNKRINKMQSHEDFVYIACGIGIMKLNPVRREIADTYYPFANSTPILDLAFHGDTIFALSQNSIRWANKNNIALADYTQWQTYSGVPNIGNASFRNLVLFNDQLWLHCKTPPTSYATDTVYRRTGNTFDVVQDLLNSEIHDLRTQNGNLFFSADARLVEFTPDLSPIEVIFQYDEGSFIAPNGAVKIGLDYYIADKNFGLIQARNSFGHQKIGFQGPFRNSFFALDFKNDKLLSAGGGLVGFNQSFNTSGVYIFEDEKWSYINGTNAVQMAENTWDVISVSIDPNDGNHFAFGTYSGRGLFEVKDGKNIDNFYTSANSPLELTSLGNNSYAVSELFFDNQSNLWIGQSYSSKPLKVKTKDGVFIEFDLGPTPSSRVISDLTIDFNGYKWLATRGGGLIVFDDNNTLLDPADDQFKIFRNGEGQGNLPSNQVTSVCVDFNNDIWVGTDNGLVVLYNSARVFNEDGVIDAQPILLQFEEEIERLLGNTAITKIALDGGNRKWVATESAGVILFGTDGRQEVYNFNTSNSPLMSNTVLDIAINDKTGEVFFVTEKGLQSFRSDASTSDLEYSDVQVFPNPFRAEFNGVVTIQGIAFDSEVKITDIAGNLVYQTVSNGGTATWNGQTLQGARASSGVYQIWTAPRNGKGRYVGKFVLIN